VAAVLPALRPRSQRVSGPVRWPERQPCGSFCDLRLRTDLQYLQQALPLFANLIFSPANLNRNSMVRPASS
jgi:hypothetical protein